MDSFAGLAHGRCLPSRPGKRTTTKVMGKDQVTVTFPAPIAGLDKLFDQVAILLAHSTQKEAAVLGPYYCGK